MPTTLLRSLFVGVVLNTRTLLTNANREIGCGRILGGENVAVTGANGDIAKACVDKIGSRPHLEKIKTGLFLEAVVGFAYDSSGFVYCVQTLQSQPTITEAHLIGDVIQSMVVKLAPTHRTPRPLKRVGRAKVILLRLAALAYVSSMEAVARNPLSQMPTMFEYLESDAVTSLSLVNRPVAIIASRARDVQNVAATK